MFSNAALTVIDEEANEVDNLDGHSGDGASSENVPFVIFPQAPGSLPEVLYQGNAFPRAPHGKPSLAPFVDAQTTVYSTPLALLNQEPSSSVGKIIAASHFVAYAMRQGRVRVINRFTGENTLVRLPQAFSSTASIQDLAVHGSKIGAITSDGGLVVWEILDKASSSLSREILSIAPIAGLDALWRLKWCPGSSATLAIASRSAVYLLDLREAKGVTNDNLLSHAMLRLVSRVFPSPCPIVAFDFDRSHNAIALLAKREGKSHAQTLTMWDTDFCEVFWNHEFQEKVDPSSVTFVDSSVFIGWENDTAFTLFSLLTKVTTSSIRLSSPRRSKPSEHFGAATYDAISQTIWINNSQRKSLVAIKIGRDSPSLAPGEVFIAQITEVPLLKPVICLSIPSTKGDLDGQGARVACATARIFPGDLALVAFSVHATGVDQLIVRKETFETLFPPEPTATVTSRSDPVPQKQIGALSPASKPRDLGDKSLFLELDASPENFLERVQYFSYNRVYAWIARALRDTRSYKSILTWRNEAAQALLDHLQRHSDDLATDPLTKRLFVSTLIKLSRLSGLYPQSLVRNDIQISGADPVARGAHGEVWMGTKEDGGRVAVKVLRIFSSADTTKLLKKFSFEAVTWRQLSHPNVLEFYGIHHLKGNRLRVCLVSPWMENGNVVQYLKAVPNADRPALILDVARGLEYLHTSKPNIIHGDIKGLNILVRQSGRACLADFGLASVDDPSSAALSHSSQSSNIQTGTLRWQAPELLLDSDPERRTRTSLATDIYSFACACYEIFSGNIPFHDLNDVRVLLAVTEERKRPPPPPHQLCELRGLTMDTWMLIEACWSHQPGSRPSASRVVRSLRHLPQYASTDYYAPEEYVLIESELPQ
ncbi:hypothetical protein HWV62_45011 [Athelia sp. TMB]|nr:hypothetical protein HWV62_45011 [Athelia sp. TMB]